MVQITRRLARQLRAVFRKSVLAGPGRSALQTVSFECGEAGLTVRAHSPSVAVLFHLPGERNPASVSLSITMLDRVQGRDDSVVTLEPGQEGKVIVGWTESDVPQSQEFETERLPSTGDFPLCPDSWSSNPIGTLQALHSAAETTESDRIRFATDSIQLRGKAGEVIATDGRQLLIQSGFKFPWTDDVLVARTPVFGCRELPQDVPVEIGGTASHVAFRLGAWTLFLAIDQAGRFPKVRSIIPSAKDTTASFRLSETDAEFLIRKLPELPGNEEDGAPVTIECNGQLVVRSQAEGEPRPTELLLTQSETSGQAMCFATDRKYLLRFLKLGFRAARLVSPQAPVIGEQDGRIYVWQGLVPDSIVRHHDDAIRLVSDSDQPTDKPSEPIERRSNMSKTPAVAQPTESPEGNGNSSDNGTGNGIGQLLEQIDGLKGVLRDAFDRTHQLGVSLKRYRKHSRLVGGALASLRQLQVPATTE